MEPGDFLSFKNYSKTPSDGSGGTRKNNAVGSKVCRQPGLCTETLAQKLKKKKAFVTCDSWCFPLEAAFTPYVLSQTDWDLKVERILLLNTQHNFVGKVEDRSV